MFRGFILVTVAGFMVASIYVQQTGFQQVVTLWYQQGWAWRFHFSVRNLSLGYAVCIRLHAWIYCNSEQFRDITSFAVFCYRRRVVRNKFTMSRLPWYFATVTYIIVTLHVEALVEYGSHVIHCAYQAINQGIYAIIVLMCLVIHVASLTQITVQLSLYWSSQVPKAPGG